MVFPKIDVRPHTTDDGRVMIKFFEEGFELLPPNTSDGIYKILTVTHSDLPKTTPAHNR